MNTINTILDEIAPLINDICVNIRNLVAKRIGNFKMVSKEKLLLLFSKKNAYNEFTHGTFIHGLEDEYFSVRINTIESMCNLLKDKDLANLVFDFLIYALNDGIEQVKESASSNMLKITKKFKIIVTPEMIDLIFYNFREKNEIVKNVLYDVIVNLFYTKETTLYVNEKILVLLSKNVNKSKIFSMLRILVSKNIRHFYANTKFDESMILKRELALNDNLNYCRTIILNELLKSGLSINYPKNLEKNLFYHNLKETETEENVENIKRVKICNTSPYHDLMMTLLKNIDKSSVFEKYSSVFLKTRPVTETDKFYIELFISLREFYLNQNLFYYHKLMILYNFTVPIEEIQNLLKERYNFVSNKFALQCLKKIKKKFNLPLRIIVSCYYDCKDIENYFIRVKNKMCTRYHELQEKSEIYIYENVEGFEVGIVYVEKGVEIEMDRVEVKVIS